MKNSEKNSFAIGAKLANYIANVIPNINKEKVTWLYFPERGRERYLNQAHGYGAVELSSGAIGVTFAAYIPPAEVPTRSQLYATYIGQPASSLISKLGKPEANPVERAVAMATINALSSTYMQETGLNRYLEFADAVIALELCPSDILGMVGFFPPLVEPLSRQVSFLHVVELKEQLVQTHSRWDVTTDHAILRGCNKIMVTGSILLNGTIQSLLGLVSRAVHVALIGPTASFLPDPLFEIGFDIVGGTMIVNPVLFKDFLTKGLPWGTSTTKFVARKQLWRR